MRPPVKDQADITDKITVDASATPENKDYTRQEYKDEQDINYMLSRFGITQPRGTPTYGVWDDSIELQTAIEAVREAREGYKNLPEVLTNKFPDMESLLRAVENGALVFKDEEAPPEIQSPHDLMNARVAKLEQEAKQSEPR